MPAIRITAFIGEQPHIIPDLLPGNAGQAAVNVRLDDGALTPIRKAVNEADAADAAHTTIYRWGNTWLSWSGLVHAAPGPVAEDRLYYTGDGAPKLRVGDDVYDLALPGADTALTASLAGSGSGDVTTRIYVYTWVTAFGEESEPSPVSNAVEWQPGNTVDLTGFEGPPADRNVTRQRIYRSQTGSAGTAFYFITERDATDEDFEDDIAVDAFAEPLPSVDYNPPPDALEGLTVMPNGMMAAYVGRDLYFCEPYRPHAWPEKYAVHTDNPIMGLGMVGGVLVVTTTGNPYIAAGAQPDVVQMRKLEANLPCINKRGVVELGFGVAYPSHEGLVVVDGGGTPRMVSATLFNRDGWLRYSPATMVAGQLAGRYVAFYDTIEDDAPLQGALFIDAGNAPFLIRTDAIAAATFYDVSTGALFFLDKGTDDIQRLDAPAGAREMIYWRSKLFTFNHPTNFGAILVRTEATLTAAEQAALADLIAQVLAANATLLESSIAGELAETYIGGLPIGGDILADVPPEQQVLSVGIIADGVRVAQILTSNRPLRLPSGFRASEWQIDVTGDQQVREIIMATTMSELQQVPSA